MADENVIEDQSTEEQSISKKEQKKIEKEQKKALKKSKKKRGGFLKLILIFIIIFGAIYAFLYFDIFNIRSIYIDEQIQDTPIGVAFENSTNYGGNEGDSITSISQSKNELLEEIELLNAELEEMQLELEAEQEKNDLYVEQLEQVMPLAEEQLAFKEEKAQFDAMIADNDPEAFKEFYESMYPENAQEAYEQIISSEENNKEISDYVATFTAMDETSAGEILEIMSITDLNLVVSILNNMSADKSGAILAEMSPESAATVAKRMAPAGY